MQILHQIRNWISKNTKMIINLDENEKKEQTNLFGKTRQTEYDPAIRSECH